MAFMSLPWLNIPANLNNTLLLESAAMSLFAQLPPSWQPALELEFNLPYIAKLEAFLAAERATHAVFPAPENLFRALALTPFEQVAVVILGQDPYHDDHQAHGLAFSVQPGVKPPPSLVNIYKELESDLGIPRTKTGFLEPWAKQGVLLLNTVLSVRAHQPASHAKQGWEKLTDAIIQRVNADHQQVVFVLWGAHAQKKEILIDAQRHLVLKSAHPSPLSAKNGFFGSKPFSKINAALQVAGKPEIDWQLE
jgi:uracil-DNA glycosylase